MREGSDGFILYLLLHFQMSLATLLPNQENDDRIEQLITAASGVSSQCLSQNYFLVLITTLQRNTSYLSNLFPETQIPTIIVAPNVTDERSVGDDYINLELEPVVPLDMKSPLFLFLIDSPNLLNNSIAVGKAQPLWNAKAQFLVIILSQLHNKQIQNVFNTLWQEKCLQSVVLFMGTWHENNVLSNNVASTKCHCEIILMSYSPFTNTYKSVSLCCKNYRFIRSGHTYYIDGNVCKLWKTIQNVQGYPIKISSFNNMPYHYKLEADSFDNETSSQHVGYAGKMFDVLQQKMNFTPVFVKEYNFAHFGHKLSNGTWVGVLGDILNGDAEFTTNVLFMLKYRFDLVDFTLPLSIDSLHFLVPKASRVPQWMSLILPFEFSMWTAIFVTLLFVGVTCNCLYLLKIENRTNDFRYESIFLLVFGILLQESIPLPKQNVFRLLLIVWIYVSLVLSASYECSLIGYLTFPHYFREINTFKDIAESGLKITSVPSLSTFLTDSPNEILRALVDRYESVYDYHKAVQSVGLDRNVIFYSAREVLQYEMNAQFFIQDGQFPVHIAETSVGDFCLAYIVPRDSPYLNRINELIQRATEDGLLGKWITDALQRGSDLQRSLESSTRNVILSLGHLQAAYYLLCIGLTLSVLALGGEKFCGFLKLRFQLQDLRLLGILRVILENLMTCMIPKFQERKIESNSRPNSEHPGHEFRESRSIVNSSQSGNQYNFQGSEDGGCSNDQPIQNPRKTVTSHNYQTAKISKHSKATENQRTLRRGRHKMLRNERWLKIREMLKAERLKELG